MALSQHEQNLLVKFCEKQFKNLPLTCLLLFKEEPGIPGSGSVLSDESDVLTMKVSLLISLNKVFEMEVEEGELAMELADTFAHEYSMNLSDLLLEAMTNIEDTIVTTPKKLLKYSKMERNPILIISKEFSTQFVKEKNFVLSSITSHDIESDYFYELGKIEGTTIFVDPLQENAEFAYLLSSNIIDYRLVESNDGHYITYKLSDDGSDLIAIFKPVTMEYKINLSSGNHKFFNLIND